MTIKTLLIYESQKQKNDTLQFLMKIISNTLKELQVEVEEVILDDYNIPYYYGEIQKDINQILGKIKNADAVIFGIKVILMAPSGLFKVFFDHLTNPGYQSILKDKYGFCVALTDTFGEKESAEYILRAWEMLGGLEGGRISLLARNSNTIESIRETIEKRIENFYRICRQPGQKLPTSDGTPSIRQETVSSPQQKAVEIQEKKIAPWTPPTVADSTMKPREDLIEPVKMKPVQFENFSEQQEKDIQELAEFFKQQLTTKQKESNPSAHPIIENKKSCKQMTQNLTHYFQPHLAVNFKGIFQFHVNGEESFEGYIIIDGGECIYFDGVNDHPDIVMNMNDNVWMDILTGKISAQKAFMTGQLKVRGNFMILNKLDQLFKKM